MHKKCQVCGVEISLAAHNYAQVKYCSKDCRLKARDFRRGRNIKEDRYCLECSSLISKTERRDKIYCSTECKTKGVRKTYLKNYKNNFDASFYTNLVTNDEGFSVIKSSGKIEENILISTKHLSAVLSLSKNWYINDKGYARNSKNIMLHRFIATLQYGEIPEEAAKAYNEAATKHYGEFAVLNSILYVENVKQ